jgi:hypothetical protein
MGGFAVSADDSERHRNNHPQAVQPIVLPPNLPGLFLADKRIFDYL